MLLANETKFHLAEMIADVKNIDRHHCNINLSSININLFYTSFISFLVIVLKYKFSWNLQQISFYGHVFSDIISCENYKMSNDLIVFQMSMSLSLIINMHFYQNDRNVIMSKFSRITRWFDQGCSLVYFYIPTEKICINAWYSWTVELHEL